MVVKDEITGEEKVLLTKQGTIRKRKPKKPNTFFTQDTEDAIMEYLASDDEVERRIVYNGRIHYAFHKLVEIQIHNFKFYYTEVETVEELKHEVVCVLLEKLPRFDQSKGSKAYSYFYKVALNYLINYNNTNYKKLKGKAGLEEVDVDSTIYAEIVDDSPTDSEYLKFFDRYIAHVDHEIFNIFDKDKEVKVADAIMELFRKRENLSILSKKALYIYIREITDAPTPVVTKVIKELKLIYKEMYSDFLEGDLEVE
jgi:DNA-directed RNA polymerase specialized sigma24 family protein